MLPCCPTAPFGLTGRDNTIAGWSGIHLWKGARRFLEDAAYRRHTQMQSSAGKCLCDFDLARAGAKRLKPLHGVANEVGKLVHWVADLQKSIGALIIDTLHPGADRGGCQEKRVSRLLSRPTMRST